MASTRHIFILYEVCLPEVRVCRVNYTFDVSKKGSRVCRQYEERSLMSEGPQTFDVSKKGSRLCRQYEERSLMSEGPQTFDVSKTGKCGIFTGCPLILPNSCCNTYYKINFNVRQS